MNIFFAVSVGLAMGQEYQSASAYTPGPAAPSYSSLFDVMSKDFGNVPHGAKQKHVFTFTNKSDKPVSVVNTRSSCHCATVRALTDTAQPGEQIQFEVVYDARKFTGYRQMTITIDMQGGTYESVSLIVKGFSRQDVILEPGQVEVGVLKQGEPFKSQLRLEYAGPLDWRAGEVLKGQWTTGQLKEVSRSIGMVKYTLDVEVSPKAPRGVLHDALQVRTNDPSSPVLRVEVMGVVDGGLQAAPESVKFGDVTMGKKVVQKLMVKGDRPFQIVRARHDVPGLMVQSTMGDRAAHVIHLEWTPTKKGAFDEKLKLVAGPNNEEISVRVVGKSN